MTAAVIDGDPPLPPEHLFTSPVIYDIHWEEDESKHPDASFFLPPQHHGTRNHVENTAAAPNGRHPIDHDPTTTLRPSPTPPSAPTTQKTTISLAPPPPRIDLAALAASIRAMNPSISSHRSNDNTTTTTTSTTTTTTQDPTNKDTPLSLAPPPPRIDFAALAASIREMNTWQNPSPDDDDDFPTTTPTMPYLPTHMTSTSDNSPLPAEPVKHNPKQSADTKATADDEDSPMKTTTMTPTTPTPTNLQPTRAHHPISEPTTHHLNNPHSDDPTTHWIRTAFDPVFQAIDRLAKKIDDLYAILAEVTTFCRPSIPDPPMPMTPHPKPRLHHSQPQHHSLHKSHPFLYPPLPNRHPRHPCHTVPATLSFSDYRRYLAHNFRPP